MRHPIIASASVNSLLNGLAAAAGVVLVASGLAVAALRGRLRDAIREFAVAIAQLPQYGTPGDVASLLDHYSLSRARFIQKFTVAARSA